MRDRANLWLLEILTFTFLCELSIGRSGLGIGSVIKESSNNHEHVVMPDHIQNLTDSLYEMIESCE